MDSGLYFSIKCSQIKTIKKFQDMQMVRKLTQKLKFIIIEYYERCTEFCSYSILT